MYYFNMNLLVIIVEIYYPREIFIENVCPKKENFPFFKEDLTNLLKICLYGYICIVRFKITPL